jgi:hypothetical protein
VPILGIATLMSLGHFRHPPVSGDAGLAGMLDITGVCRTLIDPDPLPAPTTGNARSRPAAPAPGGPLRRGQPAAIGVPHAPGIAHRAAGDQTR